MLLAPAAERASERSHKPVLCSSSCSHSINLLSSADSDLGSGLKHLRHFGCRVDGTFIGNKSLASAFEFCSAVHTVRKPDAKAGAC